MNLIKLVTAACVAMAIAMGGAYACDENNDMPPPPPAADGK